MSTITNIKVNYMLLEQILRVTGTYKNICDEYKNLHGYDFIDDMFKRAKTGDINPLFQDDTARDIILGIIENITGLPAKYWSGEERIKLGIRCKNEDLNYDGESIDTVDLSDDEKYVNIEEEENKETRKIKKIRGDGNAYHGLIYQEIMKNPLHLDYNEIYDKVSSEESSETEIEQGLKTIESLYSLRGQLTVIFLNMADEIELIDNANVYKRTKWEPYIRISSKPTQHGITYSPKFVEIRKGLVQTIIRNIFDLGYVFTFRDFEKEFII